MLRPVGAPFADRRSAGRRLAHALIQYRGEDAIVLALPRGGVPVAAEVARLLELPLNLLLVRKIGVPSYPELAMGAITDGQSPIIERIEKVIRDMAVTEEQFGAVRDRELAEIERRRRIYGRAAQTEAKNRTVILVDVGIATGATMTAAVAAVKRQGARKEVVTAPVAAPEAKKKLLNMADQVVVLDAPEFFGGVGQYYADFVQLTDADVLAALSVSDQRNQEDDR